MKQEYQITHKELDDLINCNKVEIISNIYLTNRHDICIDLAVCWNILGKKYGFDPITVEPSAKGILFLLAEPIIFKPQTIGINTEECRYIQDAIPFLNPKVTNALKKIVVQLELCNYETSDTLHALKDNVAFIALQKMANTTFDKLTITK